MKLDKIFSSCLLLMLVLTLSSYIHAQLNMTVNSLADDQYAYAWDDPATPEDESIDGICQDELGRCTIRAAIDESSNMSQSLNLFFSVNGQIDLIDFLYPVDGSHISGNGQVEITGPFSFQVENDCRFENLIFNQMQYEALAIYGDSNYVGFSNTFKNCGIGVDIWGNRNTISGNYFGIDNNNNLGQNTISVLVTGSYNNIDLNIICGSLTGISVAEGFWNNFTRNYIGTNSAGDQGIGNVIGIAIDGSDGNEIGNLLDPDYGNVISGNSVAGISIGGVPPDSYSENNFVYYNIIGLDITESYAIPNGNGLVITNGARNEGIEYNIMAGNTLSGIHIFGQDDETKTSQHYIFNNYIGVNSSNVQFPNDQNGINIWGNVEDVLIGVSSNGEPKPNITVGNQGNGIYIADQFGYYPSKITVRKNILYQNNSQNFFVSALSNEGITPPYSLSFSNNTIAGISDDPGALIDVYKANINEFSPSAYQWLGSTIVGSNGVFSYEITDPSVEAVSLAATDNNGNTSAFAFIELITDVEKENNEIPSEYTLKQNYPNPFNPLTTISFSIPNEEFVTIRVFNSLGEEVAELVNENFPAGNYSISFNASELTSGVYYYKIVAGNYFQTRKMMLVK